jgi:hypothetical protein
MARHPLTYRAARRNIVLREAKMKSQWTRFRLFGGGHPQIQYVLDFLEGVRRHTERAA